MEATFTSGHLFVAVAIAPFHDYCTATEFFTFCRQHVQITASMNRGSTSTTPAERKSANVLNHKHEEEGTDRVFIRGRGAVSFFSGECGEFIQRRSPEPG